MTPVVQRSFTFCIQTSTYLRSFVNGWRVTTVLNVPSMTTQNWSHASVLRAARFVPIGIICHNRCVGASLSVSVRNAVTSPYHVINATTKIMISEQVLETMENAWGVMVSDAVSMAVVSAGAVAYGVSVTHIACSGDTVWSADSAQSGCLQPTTNTQQGATLTMNINRYCFARPLDAATMTADDQLISARFSRWNNANLSLPPCRRTASVTPRGRTINNSRRRRRMMTAALRHHCSPHLSCNFYEYTSRVVRRLRGRAWWLARQIW